MTSTGVRTAEHPESNGDCMTAVASLLVGAGFFSLWFWLLPGWLGFHVETTGAARWRWIAAVPSVLGFAVALRCVWDFGRTGHGTPAPIAPPKRLVVVGFYRYVRNPMYVGFLTGWAGLWVVFGRGKYDRAGTGGGGGDCGRVVCAAIRGTDAAQDVWRGV